MYVSSRDPGRNDGGLASAKGGLTLGQTPTRFRPTPSRAPPSGARTSRDPQLDEGQDASIHERKLGHVRCRRCGFGCRRLDEGGLCGLFDRLRPGALALAGVDRRSDLVGVALLPSQVGEGASALIVGVDEAAFGREVEANAAVGEEVERRRRGRARGRPRASRPEGERRRRRREARATRRRQRAGAGAGKRPQSERNLCTTTSRAGCKAATERRPRCRLQRRRSCWSTRRAKLRQTSASARAS
jgi:hypothetical protein